jgi:hypothetical protein
MNSNLSVNDPNEMCWYKVSANDVQGIFRATAVEVFKIIEKPFEYKPNDSYREAIVMEERHFTLICPVAETPHNWSCGDDPVDYYKEFKLGRGG